MSFPIQAGRLHIDFDACQWRPGIPQVLAVWIKPLNTIRKDQGLDPDATAKGSPEWCASFLDVKLECTGMPANVAGPNVQTIRCPVYVMCSPLGHAPPLTPFSVDAHIQSAILFRARQSTCPRASVVRRKDAANEGNDHQAEATRRVQCIEVPPSVSSVRHGCIKKRRPRFRHEPAPPGSSARALRMPQ